MIRERLYKGVDIYAGFDADSSKVDMQGWGSDHPILPWTIENLKPQLIIEVGSWKGRSAINMAKHIQSLGLDTEVLCIDTWLGSPEHWQGPQDYWDSLRMTHGRPQLYDTFINNVIANGCKEQITPLSLNSEAAFYVLQKLGVQSSMIYIDAGHEYDSVMRDMQMYWQLLEDGGVMILDDYVTWPGVTKAVDTFAIQNNLPIIGEKDKAVLSKNCKLNFSTKIIF